MLRNISEPDNQEKENIWVRRLRTAEPPQASHNLCQFFNRCRWNVFHYATEENELTVERPLTKCETRALWRKFQFTRSIYLDKQDGAWLSVEELVSKMQNLKLQSCTYRQPVEVPQSSSNIVKSTSTHDQRSCAVLQQLRCEMSSAFINRLSASRGRFL